MSNMDKYVKQISKDIPEDYIKEAEIGDNDRWLVPAFGKPILDNPKGPNDKDKYNHVWAPTTDVAVKKFKAKQVSNKLL